MRLTKVETSHPCNHIFICHASTHMDYDQLLMPFDFSMNVKLCSAEVPVELERTLSSCGFIYFVANATEFFMIVDSSSSALAGAISTHLYSPSQSSIKKVHIHQQSQPLLIHSCHLRSKSHRHVP